MKNLERNIIRNHAIILDNIRKGNIQRRISDKKKNSYLSCSRFSVNDVWMFDEYRVSRYQLNHII